MQFTYSKSKICEEATLQWQKIVEDLEEQERIMQADLEQMYKPFDFMASILMLSSSDNFVTKAINTIDNEVCSQESN